MPSSAGPAVLGPGEEAVAADPPGGRRTGPAGRAARHEPRADSARFSPLAVLVDRLAQPGGEPLLVVEWIRRLVSVAAFGVEQRRPVEVAHPPVERHARAQPLEAVRLLDLLGIPVREQPLSIPANEPVELRMLRQQDSRLAHPGACSTGRACAGHTR